VNICARVREGVLNIQFLLNELLDSLRSPLMLSSWLGAVRLIKQGGLL
jgi:hypothetical protein